MRLPTVFLVLSLVFNASALQGDGGCDAYMCVNATVIGDTVTYELTPLFRRSAGWMALGWGSHMRDTHMCILWRNEDNSTTISQRYTSIYAEPKVVYSPPRIATVTSIKSAMWHDSSLTTLAFEVPLNRSHSGSEQLVWAYGLARPGSSFPDAIISKHFATGKLELDLNKDLSASILADSSMITTTAVSTKFASRKVLLILHGIGITLGMVVLLPMSALSARYLRTFTSKWVSIHKLFNMFVAMPVIVVSWLLGPLAVMGTQSPHFTDAHHICGLTVLILYLVQVCLGQYIHRRPKMTAHPPLNILHVAFGCTLITLSFLQIRSGLNEWESAIGTRPPRSLYISLGSWALTLLVVYVLGLALLRRQFSQEKAGARHDQSNYMALSHDDASPTFILKENGDDEIDEDTIELTQLQEKDATSFFLAK